MLVLIGAPARAETGSCNNSLQGLHCQGHLAADQEAGQFHGLLMATGDRSLLDRTAHMGTKPGCGDCTWTIVPACSDSGPGGPDDFCAGATNTTQCRNGTLFRIYLSTATIRYDLVGTECVGGNNRIIHVGDQAAADVERYLKDIAPPLVDLHVQPASGIPAGMPSYFWVRTPEGLQPQPFGGGQITETITISPQRYQWTWGDGAGSGWITDAGGPYPDGTVTHTYDKAGRYDGTLTTEWGATYTITVAGQTFGPYDATGTLTRNQPFRTTVLRAHSALVSHG
jgi:hypothetical protein